MAIAKQPKEFFDRLPPHSAEAERSVLGAMLLNPDAVGTAIEILRESGSDVFYVEAHRHIYDAMVGLFRKSLPVDATTLQDQLKSDGVLEAAGDALYLADLSGAVPTSANVEYYAQIVLDTSIQRKLISICSGLAGEAYTDEAEVSSLLDKAEAEIFAIAERRQLTPIHALKDLLVAGVERLEKLKTSRTGITGLATGFPDLDKMLMGFQPSDMIVLAARPSVGKTALALNIARNVAIRENKGVLIFSLEMSKEQLTQRLLCLEAQLDMRRLREGFQADREFQKLGPAADKLSRAKFFIDDTPNINVLDIRSKARRHASQHDLDLLIIDYLQLMSGRHRSESRQVEIAEISRAVKTLGRELAVPVLALSQLSREAERDESGRPKLSHLRESGAIEQDADVVLMLWRPPAHETEGNENFIRLEVAKQRNGPTGTVDLLFEKYVQRFRTLSRSSSPEGAPPPEIPSNYEDLEGEDAVPF